MASHAAMTLSRPTGAAPAAAVRRASASTAACPPMARWTPSGAAAGRRWVVRPVTFNDQQADCSSWAASSGFDSGAADRFWGGLGNVLKELEEGNTGLLDTSPPFSMRARRGASFPRPIPMDVFDEEGQVVVQMDLPGLKREEIKIEMGEGRVLTISVERKRPETPPGTASPAADASAAAGAAAGAEAAGEGAQAGQEQAAAGEAASPGGKSTVRLERPYGSFLRRIRLPANVTLEGISARLAEGVLTLTIPKAPTQEPQRVDIRVE